MRVDFLGLAAFLSIAERGSFQRAAVHLNLSQTAHLIRRARFGNFISRKMPGDRTRLLQVTIPAIIGRGRGR